MKKLSKVGKALSVIGLAALSLISGCTPVDNNTDTRSSNAGLGSLTAILPTTPVTELTISPAVSADVTNYTVIARPDTTQISIGASTADAKATLTINSVAPTDGAVLVDITTSPQDISLEVTAENKTKKTYILTVTKAANTAPTKGTLTVSGTPSATGIVVTVGAATDDFTAAADLEYEGVISTVKAEVETLDEARKKAQSYEKNVGSVSFTDLTKDTTYYVNVIVKDAQGAETLYDVLEVKTAAVLSAEKAMSAFKLGDIAGTIDETAKTVTVNVPYGTNVTALVGTFTISAGASAKVADTAQVSGTTANNYTSAVTFKITAEDGSTVDYAVSVVVAAPSTDATLSALSLSGITLSPAFAAGTTAYSADVTFDVANTTVTATKAHSGATIKVNTTTVASGTASSAITLNTGANTITVEVTAQDGTTKKNYVMTVNKGGSIRIHFRPAGGWTGLDTAGMKVVVGSSSYTMTKDAASINYWTDDVSKTAWYGADVPGSTAAALEFHITFKQNTTNWALYDSTSTGGATPTKVKISATPSNGHIWVDRHDWYSDATGDPKLAKVTGTVTTASTAPNDKAAASVSITGTGVFGEVLTANITYSDAESDAENASAKAYQWKVSDTSNGTYTDIASATNSTFTPDASYTGKFIKVLGTVAASAGNTTAGTGLSDAKAISGTAYPSIVIDGTVDTDWSNATYVQSFTDSDAGMGWAKNFDTIKVTNTATDLILQIKLKDGVDHGTALHSLQVYIDSDSSAATGKTDFRSAATLFGDGAGNVDGWNMAFPTFGADLAFRFGWNNTGYYSVKFPDATGAATSGSSIYFNQDGAKDYAEIKIPFTELTSITPGTSSIKILFAHANTWAGATATKGQIIDCYPKATSGASAEEGTAFNADNFITYSVR